MHEVKINKTIIHVPSSWNELTRKQLELIAGLALHGFEKSEFKRCLLFYAAGIQVQHLLFRDLKEKMENLYQVKLPDGSTAQLSAAQIDEIASLFNFLFITSENSDAIAIDSHLTVNLILKFKVNGIIYYGPSDKLFNITMSEFIHADNNLTRYLKTKESQFLDKLIAVLYRPQDHKYNPESPDFNGDRRCPFNDHRIDDRARKIRKLNRSVKLAILYFYQGCQLWYQYQFPHVFKPGKKPSNDLGLLNLVDALTGGDVTKTDEVRRSYLMDVMVHLERAAIEYEEMEQKLKKK